MGIVNRVSSSTNIRFSVSISTTASIRQYCLKRWGYNSIRDGVGFEVSVVLVLVLVLVWLQC